MKSNMSHGAPFVAAGSSGSLVLVLTLLLNIGVYAQTNTTSTLVSDESSLLIMVNLARIRNQILLAEKSLDSLDHQDPWIASYTSFFLTLAPE